MDPALGQEFHFFCGQEQLQKHVLTYDSITVSSAWDLTSVSMRYSQGEGVNTSLSRNPCCVYVTLKTSVNTADKLVDSFFSQLAVIISLSQEQLLCALVCVCVFDPIYSGASLRLLVYV